ncbi:MAG: DUF4233 domain-containing protein [Sciscionella sp.]
MSSPQPERPDTGAQADAASAPDPMKSFHALIAGTLILQAIVLALSLLVVAKFDGVSAGVWVVLGLVVVLIVSARYAGHDRLLRLILGLQVVLIACAFFRVALGVIGVLFLGVWLYLWWIRRDVARRMAAGTLPAQQARAATPGAASPNRSPGEASPWAGSDADGASRELG